MIGRVLLVVDVGNSDLTLCGVHDGALGAVRRATTERGATADELELLLDGLLRLDGHRLDEVSAIALASVVPTLTALGRVADGLLIPLRVAEAGHLPLPVRVDRPLEVGADRLVNALAAHRLHGSPSVVADVGTAITVDAVAADGAFLGGAIAAGPELRALAGSTAKRRASRYRSQAGRSGATPLRRCERGRSSRLARPRLGPDRPGARRTGSARGSPTRGGADDPDRRPRGSSGRTASTSTSSIRCSRCAASRSSTPR